MRCRALRLSMRQLRWCRAVSVLTGYGVLANTSFNSKGRPMVNSVRVALALLDAHHADGLSAVLIENWYFDGSLGRKPS